MDDCDISAEESGKVSAAACAGSGSSSRRAASPAPLLVTLPSLSHISSPSESCWHQAQRPQSYFVGPGCSLSSPSVFPSWEQGWAGCTGTEPVITRTVCFSKRTELKARPEMFRSMFLFCFLFLDENRNTRSADFQENLFLSDLQLVFVKPREMFK